MNLNSNLILEGEPRFELSYQGKLVDTIRVGRYDLRTLRKLLEELGVKRDDNYSYDKKAAEIQLEKAFKQPQQPKQEF